MLDTSAVRALPTRRLADLSLLQDLFVSPFCFWELLSHVHEEGQFKKLKGMLMKFEHLRLLDDPGAIVDLALNPNLAHLQNRVSDDDIIYATLAALRESESLESFYSKEIRDGLGQVRLLSQCAERAEASLQSEEWRYKSFVTKILDLVKSKQTNLDDDQRQHQAALSLAEGWRASKPAEMTIEEMRRIVVPHAYTYCSFVIQRSIDYLSSSAKIDQNDFEDARLCLHLALGADFIVVTCDKALRRAVERTIDLLNRVDPTLKPAFSVQDIDSLRQ